MSNTEIVQSIYAAFGRQDLPRILSTLDEDVSWGIDSIASDVPPYGIRRGKDGVASFFADWGRTADFLAFEAKDFVATGDHVFCDLHYTVRVKSTNKTSHMVSAQHWTFRNGKLIRWRGYEDTVATRAAFTP
jgi:ketosteroid isomerase-like protein